MEVIGDTTEAGEPYRPIKGFTLKEKTIEEMAQEKEKYRVKAAESAKENVK